MAEFGSVLIESGLTTVSVDGNFTLNGPSRGSYTLDHIRGNFALEQRP